MSYIYMDFQIILYFVASKINNTRLVHFPYKVKLRLMAHSRNFLSNQKARNAMVGVENLLKPDVNKPLIEKCCKK